MPEGADEAVGVAGDEAGEIGDDEDGMALAEGRMEPPGPDAGGSVSAGPMWTCTLPKGRPTAWGEASGVACIQLT